MCCSSMMEMFGTHHSSTHPAGVMGSHRDYGIYCYNAGTVNLCTVLYML